ncbi:hypothetical protein [Brevundimonas sp.]|uniref:hypothetical protein n=1 Tax=Brevundimonas sp. TaxID=1871086 RepID=UPI002FCC7F94
MTMMISVLSALALGGSMSGVMPERDQDAVVATARSDGGSVSMPAEAIVAASPSSTVSSAGQNIGAGSSLKLTTAQQIDNWLSEDTRRDEMPVWRDEEPRRMTGEVSLGIGSHDYSNVSGYVDLPVGENATVSLGFSQTKNGWYERPIGRDGLFWDPRDPYNEWGGLGRRMWTTPSGQSVSPFDAGPRISRHRGGAKSENADTPTN